MKRYGVFLLSVILLFSLAGCSQVPKSENAIKQDIQESTGFFSEYVDLKITDFEIVERKTDRKNSTDEINCSLSAANEDFIYTAQYVLKYHLYDQGWMLEGLEQKNIGVTPKKASVTSDVAYEDMGNTFTFDLWNFEFYTKDDFVFESDAVDLTNKTHDFYFKSTDGKKTVCVRYEFVISEEGIAWKHTNTTVN